MGRVNRYPGDPRQQAGEEVPHLDVLVEARGMPLVHVPDPDNAQVAARFASPGFADDPPDRFRVALNRNLPGMLGPDRDRENQGEEEGRV